MSYYDEDFDPEMHTPEEIEAHKADEQRLHATAQLLGSLDDLDTEQAALDRLADLDPVGFVLCGQPNEDFDWTAEQADEWLESRLHVEAEE